VCDGRCGRVIPVVPEWDLKVSVCSGKACFGEVEHYFLYNLVFIGFDQSRALPLYLVRHLRTRCAYHIFSVNTRIVQSCTREIPNIWFGFVCHCLVFLLIFFQIHSWKHSTDVWVYCHLLFNVQEILEFWVVLRDYISPFIWFLPMIQKSKGPPLALLLADCIDTLDNAIGNGHGGKRLALQHPPCVNTANFHTPLEVARWS
jgi:hypothetical protein